MRAASNTKTIKKKASVKKPKDANAPKPPLTPYLRFGASVRAKDQKLSALPVGQQGKMLSEMWNNLPEDEKEVIKSEYNTDREEYEKLLEKYKLTDDYKNHQKLLKSLGLSSEKKTKKLSGYNVYYKEHYGKVSNANKGLEMKGITTILLKNWKELDEKTKQVYVQKANEYNESVKENKTDNEE